jgi:hypothetical protein
MMQYQMIPNAGQLPKKNKNYCKIQRSKLDRNVIFILDETLWLNIYKIFSREALMVKKSELVIWSLQISNFQ